MNTKRKEEEDDDGFEQEKTTTNCYISMRFEYEFDN